MVDFFFFKVSGKVLVHGLDGMVLDAWWMVCAGPERLRVCATLMATLKLVMSAVS
jgi:hypothetical protein